MIVLLYFYMRQKRISLNTEKAFLREFFVTFFCIVFDILSIIVLKHRDILPELFVRSLCKSYLVTLVGEAFCGLLYVCVDIYPTKREYRKKVRIYEVIALVGMLLIYFLPLGYKYAADGVTILYTYGGSVYATYLFAIGFLVVIFYLTEKKKNRMSPARRQGVRFWMLLWVGASLIQLFNGSLLIVGYMSAIGMVILYLKLENPETNIDRQSGLFNHSALIQYTKQLFGTEQEFAVITLALKEPLHKSMRSDRTGAADAEILEFLFGIREAFVFKETENEIVLVFEDPGSAETNMHRISQRFQSGWGEGGQCRIKYCLIYMPDARVVNNADDMLYLIHDISRSNNGFLENHMVLADKAKAEEVYRKKETEKLIADAIEKDRVAVYYQPIFSTKEDRFVSAEALVRIQDDDGRVVPPGAFIEVAEQNGAIVKLGEMVFEKVCRMIREKDIKQYGLHYLEINLSVVQCADEHLAETYMQIMEKYGISAEQANLEITESASLDAKAVLLHNMKKLIAYGIHFSLDDFGTGQSNLNYIMDMPVAIVKFDKDMTTAYFHNEKARYVMNHAINMIHGMGLEIVSEGIETKEMYQTMKDLGISYIQGYYFSKPLPEDAFWEFIRERNANH